MTERNSKKLNWLEQNVPEGLLVTASWLSENGYSTSLRSQYVSAGWLEQPARGVYRRPRGSLRWEQVVISLQTLLDVPVIVGGRTALELQGYTHYLAQERKEVHIYGPQTEPGWLHKLPMLTRFVFHRSGRLFDDDLSVFVLSEMNRTDQRSDEKLSERGLTVQHWGQWDWSLTLSAPDRAILEMLDELPGRESFHQADKLMEGLASLSPRRLQRLLERCKSVKVKRLFFYFAGRHKHSWLSKIDRSKIDLGKGKRMLVRGGKLDPTYEITVPEDMDAVQ